MGGGPLSLVVAQERNGCVSFHVKEATKGKYVIQSMRFDNFVGFIISFRRMKMIARP